MAVLPIRTFGDPVLRQAARPVERVTQIHERLIADMRETMRAAPGVGLAGPQVGVMERLFVWEYEENGGALINPVITDRSKETVEEEEGCLSLPGLSYPVARAVWVKIDTLDEHGDATSFVAEDYLARIYQHEIDHLDGVLFIDRLPEDLRKEALTVLRDQALGLPGAVTPTSREEAL